MSPKIMLVAVSLFALLVAGRAIAVQVDSSQSPGAFQIAGNGEAAPIVVESSAYPGVLRAGNDLNNDIQSVTGLAPTVVSTWRQGPSTIIIGTIGKSALIDQLASAGKIDISTIQGKWEACLTQVVANPMPGIASALVIAGSDKRGTIYGIYDVSEQIGVSPWYWWADVPPHKHDALFVKAGTYVLDPPKVKYRGIFINDEEPAFGPWAREKFGGINSKMYTHMFELILRLKGNYLWPAMWGKAFNEDDPENPKLADEYGIVMGTSHHEPMIRAQAEWGKHRREFGNDWNYATNADGLYKFWEQGIERNKNYESIVTIGMRGDGDEPMIKGGDIAANSALLERIVADQRKILAEKMNPDVTKIPQVWALYKEVSDYYDHGMRVPDDVTLLWCDDNWGNIRRLPTADERNRAGGAGIYYHFDYVGGPRSYKWLNTNPLPKAWEQMNLAYNYGADRIWIVNVGDLKPMEIPIEFFLKQAWNPEAMTPQRMSQFTHDWALREFGPTHAREIADIVNKYAKYNGWRKPEMLDANTFSLVNYQEADRVEAAWQAITKQAEEIYATLPPEYRDAFFELVLYPTKASATVVQLHIATGRNHLYASQQRASANDQAQRVRDLFKLDQELSDQYHQIANGKWNHMMAQTRIGFTSWQDPKTNILPKLTEVKPVEGASLGVAIEGSESAWPGGKGEAKLPAFDSLNQQTYPIDIFNRGTKSFAFSALADKPWIKISKRSGNVDEDQRLWVSIDWSAAPVGKADGAITVSRTGGEKVDIGVTTIRSDTVTRESLAGAVGGLTGPIAIRAADANRNVPANGVKWDVIPDYGRGAAGMSIFPVTAASVPSPTPQNSPHLEYKMYLPDAGDYQVDVVTNPSLNFAPDRGVRVGLSFDSQKPQVIDGFAEQILRNGRNDTAPAIRDWPKWVTDNVRTVHSTHTINEAGVHTLNLWMVDPGVVVEKLIIHRNNLRPSYFGPVGRSAIAPAPGGVSVKN